MPLDSGLWLDLGLLNSPVKAICSANRRGNTINSPLTIDLCGTEAIMKEIFDGGDSGSDVFCSEGSLDCHASFCLIIPAFGGLSIASASRDWQLCCASPVCLQISVAMSCQRRTSEKRRRIVCEPAFFVCDLVIGLYTFSVM